MKPNVHFHRCVICNFVWCHTEVIGEFHPGEHLCRCGEEQYQKAHDVVGSEEEAAIRDFEERHKWAVRPRNQHPSGATG